MFNCIKESFNLTNRYIILATPLILFSLLSSLYILFSLGGNLISLVIAITLFVLMLAAFISGWGFMIKSGILEPEREDVNSLMKEFPSGVGEYFLPALGSVLNILVFSGLMLILAYAVGMKFIGSIGITPAAMSGALESAAALKAFIMSLSDEQLYRLNAWNLILFAAMGLDYFLLMFYIPAVFYKSKNPFKAFFISIKDLFSRNFLINIALYMLIFISYFFLSVLATILGANVIAHFILTLINFYYLTFAAVLVFNYYYSKFIKAGGMFNKTV